MDIFILTVLLLVVLLQLYTASLILNFKYPVRSTQPTIYVSTTKNNLTKKPQRDTITKDSGKIIPFRPRKDT